MLVYYCNKNKRVVLSVILVFLCGINYICGEKKADQEGKAIKQISATKLGAGTRELNQERCGAVVKRRTRDREVPGSIPTNCKCCFLEQETLSTLLIVLVSTQEKRGPHGRLVLDY